MARREAPRDSEQFAIAAVAVWRDLWTTLSPIIGVAGTAALYHRTLFLRGVEYPWLAKVYDESDPGEFGSLRRELVQQSRADAAAANAALLQSLSLLLSRLIGVALTRRLLQPVWDKHGQITLGNTK